MSYQYKRADTRVVVCDLCGNFSWVSNRNWREMPQRADNQPVHLCPACHPVAIWCPTHQQYHLPDVFHRRACVDCGGLFTSIVREQITRCPACRRSVGAYPASALTAESERSRSFVQKLLSLRGR